jgi:hypothetical protein
VVRTRALQRPGCSLPSPSLERAAPQLLRGDPSLEGRSFFRKEEGAKANSDIWEAFIIVIVVLLPAALLARGSSGSISYPDAYGGGVPA